MLKKTKTAYLLNYVLEPWNKPWFDPRMGHFWEIDNLWIGVVAHKILVSAQGPLVLGFWVFGFLGLGPELDNWTGLGGAGRFVAVLFTT